VSFFTLEGTLFVNPISMSATENLFLIPIGFAIVLIII